tara:strand:- start:578 stop:1072 length:495 start_codon:yes stop_codon:yes gene_type:complete
MSKSKFKGPTGLPITEGLFLECNYDKAAIYTLKDEDCTYEGRKLPSIKLLYLAEVTSPIDGEYDFANKYFLNWKQWERICRNKRLRKDIDEWREELEVKLRSQGIKLAIDAADGGNYQAAKWMAEGGFARKVAGRPSKASVEQSIAIDKRLYNEYEQDIQRLNS